MTTSPYKFRQLLELEACTGCRLCVEACPAVAATADGRLSGLYRLDYLKKLLKSKTGLIARLFKTQRPSAEDLKLFSDTVFKCTLCAGCQEVCPAGIHLKDLWCALRNDLVLLAAYPEKIDQIRDNLLESRNVFGEDNEERVDWVEDMPDPREDGYVKDQAEVVYFAGCVAAYYPLAQNIPMAMAEILDLAGVDFTLLGQEEWCCGFPLLGAGLQELLPEFIEHNTQAVLSKKAEKLIFACPSCYRIWQEYYPRTIEIAHFTEYMDELISQKKVLFNKLPLKVTYHDPCDLGRGARVFESPRRIISAIPGLELVEMARNRENCRCCGGGGNLEMVEAGLSSEITRQKIEEALATGAQAIVTSCQQCLRTMTTYVRRNSIPLEVMDITRLVLKALKQE